MIGGFHIYFAERREWWEGGRISILILILHLIAYEKFIYNFLVIFAFVICQFADQRQHDLLQCYIHGEILLIFLKDLKKNIGENLTL